VLVGGDGPGIVDRVLAFGDGWIPNYHPRSQVFERIEELRARADRPISLHVFMPAEPAELERIAQAGARRAIHWLPSGGRSTVEAELERWEAAIAQFTGG
jgi:alkanesulfonate monooxygenase SsuD/methylene tetrahydromethanopterin reductase-like flavin-dependent oxidoreductase (luciferase family)